MKINPLSNQNILGSYQASKSAPAKATQDNNTDKVTVSKEALSFSKVLQEVDSRTAAERAHIADITEAVRKGEYKIDSALIADKILESVFRN